MPPIGLGYCRLNDGPCPWAEGHRRTTARQTTTLRDENTSRSLLLSRKTEAARRRFRG